jgi:all-trans-retinol 13,14-reductase
MILLVSQWGDYGVPHAQSPFAVHATIAMHYLNGAFYPVGGAGSIAQSVEKIVAARGGKFLLNREVTEILIENDRAVGVNVRKVTAPTESPLETYYAPIVISDTGAAMTYLKLIPADYPISFRESLRQFVQKYAPITNVTLYLGLVDDPRWRSLPERESLGFQGENYWIYESIDHDATYEQRKNWIFTDRVPQCYISFPSLKDPQATAHTAEIIAWVDYEAFTQWQTQPWRHLDADYQQLKERIGQMLIQQVDRHYPGFRANAHVS